MVRLLSSLLGRFITHKGRVLLVGGMGKFKGSAWYGMVAAMPIEKASTLTILGPICHCKPSKGL